MWKKAIESGSPPCSPQMPSLSDGLASRPDPRAQPDEPAHARPVDRLERRAVEDPLLEVVREEAGLDVVARQAERGLREVVRAEGEEVGLLRDPVGDEARARELDHRPDQRAHVVGAHLRDHVLHPRAQDPDLLLVGDEREHDLDLRRVAEPVADRAGGGDDRLHLHVVDLRGDDPQPRAARARASGWSPPASARGPACARAGARRPAARGGRARARPRAPRRTGGTRAAAGRAAGSSPAGRPSPRTAPRSPRSAAAAARRGRHAGARCPRP